MDKLLFRELDKLFYLELDKLFYLELDKLFKNDFIISNSTLLTTCKMNIS